MPDTPPWESRLRTARTLFIHRWHAAQNIGEWFGNESVGARFEHINHARSLAQYVWRYGAFLENEEETERVPEPVAATALHDIVKPVAARSRKHFEIAVRYAARFGASRPSGAAAGDPEVARLIAYAAKNPDIATFSTQLVDLHRAMLPYYVRMRYLTAGEAAALRSGRVPVLSPVRSPDRHPAEISEEPVRSGDLSGDLSEALLGAFARSIYRALACRARSELFETLLREDTSAGSGHGRASKVWADATGERMATGREIGLRDRLQQLDAELPRRRDLGVGPSPWPTPRGWLAVPPGGEFVCHLAPLPRRRVGVRRSLPTAAERERAGDSHGPPVRPAPAGGS